MIQVAQGSVCGDISSSELFLKSSITYTLFADIH